MSSRRNFIKIAGLGTLGGGAFPLYAMASSNARSGPVGSNSPYKELFNLGIVGYSFTDYKDDIDQTIHVVKAMRISHVALKEFQLPYDSTLEHIKEVVGKYDAAGIQITAVGVIYMRNQQQIDQAFAYAKNVGVKMITGVPSYDLLPYLEKRAVENDITVAIHNHGPEDPLFPDIDSTYEKIKNMDRHLGICMDIGHTFRCGHDPAAMYLKYHDRVYDIHFKDVTEPVAKGKTVNNGWGTIDFVSFIKALRKTKYAGGCGLENRQKDPATALAESMGHFRGILSVI